MNDYFDQYNALVLYREKIKKTLAEKEYILNQKKDFLDLEIQARIFFQTVATEMRSEVKFKLESLVQSLLESVFGNKYTFIIEFDYSLNKTSCSFYLEQDENKQEIIYGNGGGLIDILTIALRVSLWCLSGTEKVLILDEPMKWVSLNRRKFVVDFLKDICEKLGLQIIMVKSHNDETEYENANIIFLN
jgi:hypothetical protein